MNIMIHILNLILLQLPPGSRNPDDNSPLDLTDPFNIIVFIILPIVIVVFYIIWRKSKNRGNQTKF